MIIFEAGLLLTLIVCAISVSLTKKVLSAIIIFMSYSTVMAVVWVIIQSPDLGMTEAAVGAGITSVLFFLTFRRINKIDRERA